MRIIIAIVMLAPLTTHAATALEASRAVSAPIIDGKLDDVCWQQAKPFRKFLINSTDMPAKWKSDAYVRFDDEALYVGVRCHEPDISSISTRELPRDHRDVFNTDCVEIMLDPTRSRNDYIHIGINASGSIADRACTQGGHIGDFSFDANVTGASFIGDDYWSCELRIPFANLGITAEVGSTWGINICREKKRPQENSSILARGVFNIAGSFAELRGVEASTVRYRYGIGPVQPQTIVKAGALELSLEVPVDNGTGTTDPVLLDAWLISPTQQVAAAKEIITPSAEAEQRFTLGPMLLTEQGEYTCYVRVADPVTKKTLAMRKMTLPLAYVPVTLRLIEPWYRNAIFSTQKIEQVVVALDVNMEAAALAGMTARVGIEDIETGRNLATKSLETLKKSQRVTFDVASLPDKKMRVVAQLTDKSGKPVVDTSHPLRKLPYKKGEVWLGKDLQWHVDGKPFFLNGAWNYAEDFVSDYNAFTAEKPGNVLLLNIGILNKLWYRAKSLRSEALSDEDTAMCRDWARENRDHPKLFGYYLFDEPEVSNINVAVLERAYEVMSDEDPYHPIIISNDSMHGLHAYARCADINGLHPYPVILKGQRVNNLDKVTMFIEDADKAFKNSPHKQTIAYLHQGFNYGDYGAVNNRIPTYVEYRNQNLLALICGANGFIQFNRMVAHYPELYIGMAHLTKELAYLGPIATAPTSAIRPESSVEHVKMLVKEYDGQTYLLACNADMNARQITIRLPGIKADALQVISEGRSVAFNAGAFTDEFDTYEVHVYTTGRKKADLLTVTQINKLIDDANTSRRKPGNFAFQMFEGDGVVVSASSSKADKYRRMDANLWHVVDGVIDKLDRDSNLTWQDKTDNESPDWLEIKLPKARRVGRVVVYPFEKTLKDYAVQVHTNGQWQNVDKVTDQNADQITHTFSPVTTDRVRLFITATHGPNAKVTEVEVYEQ